MFFDTNNACLFLIVITGFVSSIWGTVEGSGDDSIAVLCDYTSGIMLRKGLLILIYFLWAVPLSHKHYQVAILLKSFVVKKKIITRLLQYTQRIYKTTIIVYLLTR